MKLRNKKTGEISEVNFIPHGTTLAELNAEWEDYEDQDEYWYTDSEGNVDSCKKFDELDRPAKEIGNYFETKAEAEKAVEKLKAWKRLKDNGFRFKTWYGGSKNIDYEITSLENETYIPRQICDDLDLLFGGEE